MNKFYGALGLNNTAILRHNDDKFEQLCIYPDSIKISAKFDTNIDALESAVYKASFLEINANDVIVTNAFCKSVDAVA